MYYTILYYTLLSALLYSTLLYSAVYYTLLYSTLLYSTLLYSLLYSLLSALLYSTPLYDTIRVLGPPYIGNYSSSAWRHGVAAAFALLPAGLEGGRQVAVDLVVPKRERHVPWLSRNQT